MAIRRTGLRASRLSSLAAAIFSICAGHSIAATTTYTGAWAGGVIGPGDTVVLNNGASVTGNVVANGTLQFNQSKPNLLVISSEISGTGSLSLTNTGTLRWTSAAADFGPVFMGLSTTVSAGLLQIGSGNGQLFVGVGSGSGGVLNVAGGFVSNADCFLAYREDSFGTASVSSGDWANSGRLFVGYEGTGTLDIAGGSVSSLGGVLASELGSVGTATVSSGTWANSGDLAVGRYGSGALNVMGGSVFNRDGTVGTDRFGVGTATVSSGTWANSGSLTVCLSGTGTLNVTGGSVTSVRGILGSQLGSVGAATVSGGTWANSGDLFVGDGGSGTLMVTGGNVTNEDGCLGYNAGSNGTATVSSGTWANGRYLVVGSSGVGRLGVTGGSVAATDGILGFNAGSTGTATVSSGTWANSGSLTVGLYGTGAFYVTGGSVTNGSGVLGSNAGSVGRALVNDGMWTNSGDLSVGRAGTGTLYVTGGSVTNRSGVLGSDAGSVGIAEVYGGTWANTGTLTVGQSGTGTLHVTGGSVTNTNGVLGYNAGSKGTAAVLSGTWENIGNLTVGQSGSGVLTMSGGLVIVGGNLWKGAYGTIRLDPGGRLQIGTGGTTGFLETDLTNNGTLVFNRSDSSSCPAVISSTGTIVNAGTGTTTLTGATTYTASLAATAGRLIVGDGSSVAGFATVSGLSAGSGATLELRSRGLAYINGLSTLTGGTILAANGISVGAGANVLGAGRISGFVSAVQGSRVEADGGNLTIGDTGSYIGFSSDGLLYTNGNEVELLDRNLAVLGSLTQLGNGVSGGSLRAANGMLLEQGKNLVGRGTVFGNFVNQGDVYGDGPTAGQQLVFAAGSTVSGNGSFTNALFNGTYAPGNSPAITNLTNGGFGSSSTLLIEIGGTQAGAQYDQVQNAGTLSLLGGTLNVVLTNSFVPVPGDTFTILQFNAVSGDFGVTVFPAFDNGLGWRRLTTGTAMRVQVAPSAVTIDVPASSMTLASSGYSSLEYAMSLDKSGTGTLELNDATGLTGPTSIQQGSIQVAHAEALSTSTISARHGGTLSLTPYLQATVGGLNPNAGGLVDVGTGFVTVASGLLASDLVAALLSGRAGGSWDGSSGITSSAAAASGGSRTVGWLDNGDGSVAFGYATAGDTNLDWTIDILDVSNFVAGGKFNSGLPATWAEGDFNYDGFADILDVADFASSGLFNAGPYNAATAAIAAVPEPSMVPFVAVGMVLLGLGTLRRRE